MKMIPLLLMAALPLGLQAATIPYTNDFSGTGGNTAFPSTDGSWTVTGGSYRNTIVAGGSTGTTSIPLTNAPGNNFFISSQFTVSSISSYTNTTNILFTLGFGALSNTTGFSSSGSNSFYLADFVFYAEPGGTYSVGDVRILNQKQGSSTDTDFSATMGNAIAAGSPDKQAVVIGTTYTLKLTGIYTASTLAMTLGVYDATGTTLIGTQATATDTSPLAGTNFGYRNRTGGTTTSSTTMNFDNYSAAAVPEPGMAVSIALSLAGMVFFLRRRRAAALSK